MAELAEFAGVIPYSVYEDEPVALIWKHGYTSPITRASNSYYSELVVRKIDEDETSAEAVARILSKLSNGNFIKLTTVKTADESNKNDDKWKRANIQKCGAKMLSRLKKFDGVALLENANGYKVYLLPVKFIKTKKLLSMIENSVHYKDCQWISFNTLLTAIYEFSDIEKMTVSNIENYKQRKHKQNKKLTEYPAARLSLQFASMIRNAHFRVIVPLFQEYKIALNKVVMTQQEQKENAMQSKQTNADDDNDNAEDEEQSMMRLIEDKEAQFVVQCKKCRNKLCNERLLAQHSMNAIEAQCAMKKDVCNCIFMDSENEMVLKLLARMGNTSEMEGLLTCWKCKFKVGRFSYCGQQCSCNEWVFPSFQISVSKVDISRKRQTYFLTDTAGYFQTPQSAAKKEKPEIEEEEEEEEKGNERYDEVKPPMAFEQEEHVQVEMNGHHGHEETNKEEVANEPQDTHIANETNNT